MGSRGAKIRGETGGRLPRVEASSGEARGVSVGSPLPRAREPSAGRMRRAARGPFISARRRRASGARGAGRSGAEQRPRPLCGAARDAPELGARCGGLRRGRGAALGEQNLRSETGSGFGEGPRMRAASEAP